MAKKASKDTENVPVSTDKSAPQTESRAMSPFREFDRLLDTFFDRGGMPSRWEHPLWQRFAAFKNGVLELTLPKLKQANRRKVEVK